MRKLIKLFTIEALILYFVTQATTGLEFSQGARSLLIAAIFLALANRLVKPIINLLLLPLNLVTFGLFRWISFAVTLFLVDLVLEEFKVSGFHFSGVAGELIKIPAIDLSGGLMAYVAFSFAISLLSAVAFWLLK